MLNLVVRRETARLLKVNIHSYEKTKFHITQVREGESWNPTAAPTLAIEERGRPATNKQYSRLTMKNIVMLMIIMIIVLFCLISLADYYSSSAPLFPYFLLLFENVVKRSV
jgi:hypothetical protein